jgi:hypothetical protein
VAGSADDLEAKGFDVGRGAFGGWDDADERLATGNSPLHLRVPEERAVVLCPREELCSLGERPHGIRKAVPDRRVW